MTRKINENVNDVKAEVSEYVSKIIGNAVDDFLVEVTGNVTDNLAMDIYDKFSDYDPNWCAEDFDENAWDKLWAKVTKDITNVVIKDLFRYQKR